MTTSVLLPQPTARCAAHPQPWLWFSTDPDDRAYAQAICHRCPLEASCRERGRGEAAGVWGGVVVDPLADFELVEPPAPTHTPSRYCFSTGCRRPECRAENAKYQAAYRAEGRCHKPQKAEEAEQLLLLEVS